MNASKMVAIPSLTGHASTTGYGSQGAGKKIKARGGRTPDINFHSGSGNQGKIKTRAMDVAPKGYT